AVLKTARGVSPSWVRIPPLPPNDIDFTSFLSNFWKRPPERPKNGHLCVLRARLACGSARPVQRTDACLCGDAPALGGRSAGPRPGGTPRARRSARGIWLEATHAINAHRGDRSGGNVARPSRQPSHSNAVVRGH